MKSPWFESHPPSNKFSITSGQQILDIFSKIHPTAEVTFALKCSLRFYSLVQRSQKFAFTKLVVQWNRVTISCPICILVPA